MGGVNASGGFDYQLWEGLARLPAWLANPAFEGMIFEGLEDIEARFFAPHAANGRVLERLQAKSGALLPADVRAVMKDLQTFEKSYPQVARVQALVTPHVPPTLTWLARDAARVRKARPFYMPFADVAAASDEKLLQDMSKEFGAELGAFVAGHVDVIERPLLDRDGAVAAFATALARAFPQLQAWAQNAERAFTALETLGRAKLGSLLPRAALVEIMTKELGAFVPDAPVVVHVRSDRNGSDETAIEIDASAFSGGDAGFPETSVWAEFLLAPLDRTARWLRAHDISRVKLGGSYRISTALALGWALRSATGFELEIPTRDGGWTTDDRGAPDLAAGWRMNDVGALAGQRLVVTIGVLRDPAADVANQIGTASMLSAYLDAPITTAAMAQASVGALRLKIAEAAARLRPEGIDLYFAGPAALAVALGHRWNALPSTRLHEFVAADRKYVETAVLG
ncbi:hypothetical protein U91I_03436 [alpha proteobacterium U9-1i]|nr:hypothetical protein U91I_03436 [alpha proteobacterium U9-1i]